MLCKYGFQALFVEKSLLGQGPNFRKLYDTLLAITRLLKVPNSGKYGHFKSFSLKCCPSKCEGYNNKYSWCCHKKAFGFMLVHWGY